MKSDCLNFGIIESEINKMEGSATNPDNAPDPVAAKADPCCDNKKKR